MSRYHIASSGKQAGMMVICPATIKCTLKTAEGLPAHHGNFVYAKDANNWNRIQTAVNLGSKEPLPESKAAQDKLEHMTSLPESEVQKVVEAETRNQLGSTKTKGMSKSGKSDSPEQVGSSSSDRKQAVADLMALKASSSDETSDGLLNSFRGTSVNRMSSVDSMIESHRLSDSRREELLKRANETDGAIRRRIHKPKSDVTVEEAKLKDARDRYDAAIQERESTVKGILRKELDDKYSDEKRKELEQKVRSFGSLPFDEQREDVLNAKRTPADVIRNGRYMSVVKDRNPDKYAKLMAAGPLTDIKETEYKGRRYLELHYSNKDGSNGRVRLPDTTVDLSGGNKALADFDSRRYDLVTAIGGPRGHDDSIGLTSRTEQDCRAARYMVRIDGKPLPYYGKQGEDAKGDAFDSTMQDYRKQRMAYESAEAERSDYESRIASAQSMRDAAREDLKREQMYSGMHAVNDYMDYDHSDDGRVEKGHEANRTIISGMSKLPSGDYDVLAASDSGDRFLLRRHYDRWAAYSDDPRARDSTVDSLVDADGNLLTPDSIPDSVWKRSRSRRKKS